MTYPANLCPLCGWVEFADFREDLGQPIGEPAEAASRRAAWQGSDGIGVVTPVMRANSHDIIAKMSAAPAAPKPPEEQPKKRSSRQKLGRLIMKIGICISRLGRRVRGGLPRSQRSYGKADVGRLAIHEHYQIFRDYLQHEDDLIHQRVSWNWAVQAFLFAAYVATLKFGAPQEHGAPQDRQLLNILTRYVIPLLGIIVSLFSFCGTKAAHLAITQLENDWNRCRELYGRVEERTFLPDLTGGGSKPARRYGIWATVYLPLATAGAWLLLLISGWLARN